MNTGMVIGMQMPGLRPYGTAVDAGGLAPMQANAAAPAASVGVGYNFSANATIGGTVILFGLLFFAVMGGWHYVTEAR